LTIEGGAITIAGTLVSPLFVSAIVKTDQKSEMIGYTFVEGRMISRHVRQISFHFHIFHDAGTIRTTLRSPDLLSYSGVDMARDNPAVVSRESLKNSDRSPRSLKNSVQ
jgi:hypothetical protein